MASVPVLDATGTKVSERDLPAVFDAKINVPLMHQVVVAAQAGLRAGTHSVKTRADVAGGGKKPWRQKGTGRARHGSIRSPIWTGGGVAHGPKVRDHTQRVNKKMRRGALHSALSDAAASGKLVCVDELAFEEPETRRARQLLEALKLEGRVLLVLAEEHEATEKSFRNLQQVRIARAGGLGTYEVLRADHVLVTVATIEKLGESS